MLAAKANAVFVLAVSETDHMCDGPTAIPTHPDPPFLVV